MLIKVIFPINKSLIHWEVGHFICSLNMCTLEDRRGDETEGVWGNEAKSEDVGGGAKA